MFEKVRDLRMEQARFEHDSACYLRAAQMGWDAILKKTWVTLEPMTDPDLYLLI